MAKQKIKEVVINEQWCKGCRICVANCPKNVLELTKLNRSVAARQDDCIVCRICERLCPELAIDIIAEDQQDSTGTN